MPERETETERERDIHTLTVMLLLKKLFRNDERGCDSDSVILNEFSLLSSQTSTLFRTACQSACLVILSFRLRVVFCSGTW